MGAHCSFGEETMSGDGTSGNGNCSATAFLNALNHVLAENGIERYDDPQEPPRVYRGHMFGCSALDHHSSHVLAELAARAAAIAPCPNLALIDEISHRVIFLPRTFPQPLATGYYEKNDGDPVAVWVGSLPQLMQELVWLARELRIPLLMNGKLSTETAFAINMFRPFHKRDTTKLIESYRTAWLALYEGARLAMENRIALTLMD